MNKIKNIKVAGAEGRTMLVDLFAKETGGRKPVVIFAHGFKGFKDWGPWDLVGEAFAEAGFVFVKFNFSHNGISENPLEFTDLEAFGQNNFSKEQTDLGKIIDWVANGNVGIPINEVSRREIFLIGHSRGGGTVLIKAGHDVRMKKLVTWASVADYGRFWSKEAMKTWEADGVTYVKNGRTGQMMPLYWQMYEDFYANPEKLNIPHSAATIQQDLLVIHGDADPVVPLSAAHELKDAQERHQLLEIKGGGHTFGGAHPWTDTALPEGLGEVVQASIDFFKSSTSGAES